MLGFFFLNELISEFVFFSLYLASVLKRWTLVDAKTTHTREENLS